MRCRPLEQPMDELTGSARRDVVAVLRDVTERKVQEQALEGARAAADSANAAKSRFLATMSYELRTPLNAIIGFSDMLKKEGPLRLDAARRNDYAGVINDFGNHLLAVVNGILDMSKIETGKFEITPEPFAPRGRRRQRLRYAGAAGGRCRRQARTASDRRVAGYRRRQTRAEPDPAEPAVERDPVYRPRRQGYGRCPRRSGEHRLRDRGYRRRHQRCRSEAGRRTVFSGCKPPTTVATAAPVSAFPSSRAWSICTAVRSKSAAASAKARALRCGCRSIANGRSRPTKNSRPAPSASSARFWRNSPMRRCCAMHRSGAAKIW